MYTFIQRIKPVHETIVNIKEWDIKYKWEIKKYKWEILNIKYKWEIKKWIENQRQMTGILSQHLKEIKF